jgi:5-hydroxyisourate hydrolase
MTARLTTHALDTMRGCGAAGLAVSFCRLAPDPEVYADQELDAGGRGVLGDDLPPGAYEIVFHVGAYQRQAGLEEPLFLEEVPVRFCLGGDLPHYHVPLLINPYGYSVYRGG